MFCHRLIRTIRNPRCPDVWIRLLESTDNYVVRKICWHFVEKYDWDPNDPKYLEDPN